MDKPVRGINAVGSCRLCISLGQLLGAVMLTQYTEIGLTLHVVRDNYLQYLGSLTDFLGNSRGTRSHFLDQIDIDKVKL